MTVTGPMDNHGSVEVQSGGVLQDSGAFTNDAVLQVDAGGLLGADSLDEPARSSFRSPQPAVTG